jgi:hypothetical protein
VARIERQLGGNYPYSGRLRRLGGGRNGGARTPRH